MGRNYRCWIVGGLRARAPVKCLCFPPCLPSKDLHILTHYGVLWSWSAWLPQPAITLIASKKLKSFKALWPHSWGKMYVCFSPSPSLSHSLSLSAAAVVCEGSDIVAPVFTACLSSTEGKCVKPRPCLCHCRCDIFSRAISMSGHWMAPVFPQRAHFPSAINPVCFCFCLFLTHTRRHIVWLTTFSLTASLVYLSDSIVRKSSLEVGCVFVLAFPLKDRDGWFKTVRKSWVLVLLREPFQTVALWFRSICMT